MVSNEKLSKLVKHNFNMHIFIFIKNKFLKERLFSGQNKDKNSFIFIKVKYFDIRITTYIDFFENIINILPFEMTIYSKIK